MKLRDYNFLQKLKTQKISYSKIPESILNSEYFQNFLENKILILEGNKYRGSVQLNEQERENFEQFLKKQFPESLNSEPTRANNIQAFRDSKIRRVKSKTVVFLRGNEIVQVNNFTVDLQSYTKKFQVFSAVLENLVCEKLCFVENLEAFLNAEKLISENYVFFHSYGRIGERLLNKIQAKEVLVFSDYDFIGLDEYLKFKEKFENVKFFIPQDFELLFEKYSKPIKDTTPTQRVISTNDEKAVYVRDKIYKTQKFLEQEVLISL